MNQIKPQIYENKYYYVDQNSNGYEKALFTKEQAIEHSKSLIYCKGCLNCQNCANCADCINCHNCFNCEDCENCQNAIDCEGLKENEL